MLPAVPSTTVPPGSINPVCQRILGSGKQENTLLLSIFDNIQCSSIFHRSSRIHKLCKSISPATFHTSFSIDITSRLLRKSVQADQRSIPNSTHKSVNRRRRSNRCCRLKHLTRTHSHDQSHTFLGKYCSWNAIRDG